MNSPEAKAQYLYLTTTGRKTGKPHEIEIWFVSHEGRYYVVSEFPETSDWVKNIQNNPAVQFRVGEMTFQGTGRLVSRSDEPALTERITSLMEVKYEWGDGQIVELEKTF